MRIDDVTGDPSALAESIDNPAHRAVLEGAGFRQLALLRCWVDDRKSFVSSVFVDATQTAFGEAEKHGGQVFMSARTALQDGALVETRLRNRGWKRALFGPLRVNHPRAGLYQVYVARPEDVAPTHEQLVRRITSRRGTTAARHDNLELFRAMSGRGLAVAAIQWMGIMLGTLPVLLLAAAIVIPHEDAAWADAALWGSFALSLLVGRLLGRRMMTLLPYPRVRPLEELLRTAGAPRVE